MSRLVDPVHFFDARGKSVLSNDWQEKELDRLRKENAELKRRLKAAVYRLRELGAAEEENDKAK